MGKEQWEGGSHRAKCGEKNEAVLRAMPSLYNNLRCPAPQCRDMLKLWPRYYVIRDCYFLINPYSNEHTVQLLTRDRGGAFRCNGPDCPLLGKRVEVWKHYHIFP